MASQLLGDLGPSPTALTERALKKLHRSFPIPAEHEVLWADAIFGTRSHGLALTDGGIFFKDGPADEDEDDDEEDLDQLNASLEYEGAGYHYICWRNFDPALIGHTDGVPTIGGAPFTDAQRFIDIANACIRIRNRRTRALRAARKAAADLDVLGAETPVRSVYRPTAGATFARCFDDEGYYDLTDDDGLPHYLEVPADQYDAVLQRMRKKIAAGKVCGIDDPDAAAALVRRGAFTQTQAVNLARPGRIAGVSWRPNTGGLVCRDPRGLSFVLRRWLDARNRVPAGAPGGARGLSDESAQAMASGTVLAEGPQKVAQVNTTNMLVDRASSIAGQTVGATGARILTSALGVTFAPVAMVASFALGNVCSKAGSEAFQMAKNLVVEPEERIVGRLFDGVLANVAFEYALTPGEQATLGVLMQHIDPAIWQRLGAALRETPNQEEELRSFVTPLCEAVRNGVRLRPRPAGAERA